MNNKLRKEILKASYEAGACHIGSALSCVDILIELYFNVLKDDDIFLFGKASGVGALYCILAEKGIIEKEKVVYYLKNYPLASKEVPGVIHSVGSVGTALSVAVGLALADRNRRVFVLLSDGDLNEGATYEAALFAHHHKLTNLYVMVDNNGFQALGATKDILGLETAFDFYKKTLPNCEIIDTIKGKGVARFENDYRWHYFNLDDIILREALEDIDNEKMYQKRKKLYLHNRKKY